MFASLVYISIFGWTDDSNAPLGIRWTTGLELFQVRIMPEFAENDDFALEPI